MGTDHKNTPLTAAAELRRKAEERLQAKTTELRTPRTEEETQRLVHELEVHQIELEMQNAELRQARDEVEATLDRYTDLYDFAPVGYFTLDRSGTIKTVNLAGACLIGGVRSRMVGRRFVLYVVAADRRTFTDFLDTVLTSRIKETCEVELQGKGNQPVIVQIEAMVTASEQEFRLALIDISMRRCLEEQLELMHSDLAHHAAKLEAANIELEAFNYSVSHDLRNPLTAINCSSQLINELGGDKLDMQCRGYVQEIHDATLRMKRLIDTLLNFSRITRIEMRHGVVDLSKMVKEITLMLKISEPERRVTFRISEGSVTAGDADLLRLVLDNLMGNAWKFTRNREDAIIEFGMTRVEGKPACFVRDNGAGFDMAHAGRLFLPFQRLSGTDVEGSGIGLATVDRIVRRHGGRVWAEGEPGKGATFYFTLE